MPKERSLNYLVHYYISSGLDWQGFEVCKSLDSQGTTQNALPSWNPNHLFVSFPRRRQTWEKGQNLKAIDSMTGAFQHGSWQIWTHFLDKLSCLSKSSEAQYKPPPPLVPYASPTLCHWTISWWKEERRKPRIFREYVTDVKKKFYYRHG